MKNPKKKAELLLGKDTSLKKRFTKIISAKL